LQGCRHELHNTRILATESSRLAESATGALQRFARQQAQTAAALAPTSASAGNAIFTIRFAFARSDVALSADNTEALLAVARTAPLIVLRGRTDGTADTPAESRMARERAGAVMAFLIQGGVDAARIRATYQPIGDPVGDNTTAAGRSLNRRVEVEVYRSLPIAIGQAHAASA
jgi:outer membrane protein OmpA-like peptidoglycan-associated protein